MTSITWKSRVESLISIAKSGRAPDASISPKIGAASRPFRAALIVPGTVPIVLVPSTKLMSTFEQRLQAQNEQIGQVTGEVANVRGELSGAKKDIVDTQTDLESTKAKLERAVGDLTGQGSLIARTREDLEELRHRGDRDYFEFSLSKGSPAQVSTVRLQLKKADPKKNKFTLTVTADDRIVEKKDRGVAEPLQFYSGRDRQLYEVVVFSVEKNKVTGYLSTPKSSVLAIAR